MTAADSPPPPDSPANRPPRLVPRFVFIGGLVGLAVVAAFFVLRFRDSLPKIEPADLETAWATWKQNRPADYDLEVEIERPKPSHVRVEVRGGKVVAMTRDGRTPTQARTWEYWTADGLFESIEREFEMAADPQGEAQLPAGGKILLHGLFEPHYGYPQRFRRLVLGNGPEVAWNVTRFETLPNKMTNDEIPVKKMTNDEIPEKKMTNDEIPNDEGMTKSE